MARLPQYQETGRVAANLPQFDFSSLRESVRVSQSLTSSLDRVSQFAFEQTAKATEKAAEQFTINNKLTLEQVQEAAKSGIKPEDLIAASGGGQIWQNTVTKIQGEQLRTQLEMLGKQALMDLQTQVDINQITNMAEVQAKQEAIVNGLRKSLSFAPDSVARFDSTMGVVTSSLYKEAQSKLVQDYQLTQQSQGIQNLENSTKAYKALIKHEDITDPATIREIELALADELERQSMDGGSKFALEQRANFVKKIDEAKINLLSEIAISDEFAPNRYEAMKKIRNNDFGNKTAIYNAFDEEDKKKVRVAASEAWRALEDSRLSQEKEAKEIADKQFREKVILQARGSSPRNTVDQAFNDGVLSYSEWKSANKPESVDSDPVTLSIIENKILDGKISSFDELPAGLTAKEKAKFNLLIRNQDEKNATKILKQGAEIADGSIFNTESQGKKLAKIQVVYEQLKDEVDANGNLKYPNKLEAAKAATLEHNSSNEIKAAKTAQRAAYNNVIKEISPTIFDYDIPRNREQLEEYAKKYVARSERKKWVNNVLKYQQSKKLTLLTADRVEQLTIQELK